MLDLSFTRALLLSFAVSSTSSAAEPRPEPTLDEDVLVALFTTGVDVAAPGAVRRLRFEVELRDPTDGSITIVSSDAPEFAVSAAARPGGGVTLTFTTAGSGDPSAEDALKVDVAVELVEASPPLAELHLEAHVLHGARTVSAVRFPVVDVVAAQTDDLVWPFGTGARVDDALTHPLVVGLPAGLLAHHPGPASMQWMAVQADAADASERPSFYLSTRDSDGVDKEYGVQAFADALRLSVRHVPPDPHDARRYDAPFTTVLGYVLGDWYDAARTYRSWALTQPWTAQGPMRTDPSYSNTARTMAVFGTFGPDPDVLDWRPWPARHLEQVQWFGTPRLVPQVYGWYQHQHDTVWGNWDVDGAFADAASPVAAAGGAFSPYTLLHAITVGHEPDVPGYDPTRLIDFAVRDGQGEIQWELDAAGNQSFEVCQSTPFARDYAAWIATRLAALGAGGVYLDMTNTLPPQRCHAAHHGHVPVDPWNTRRRLEIVAAIEEAVGDDDFYVSSESVQEVFLGRLDVGMSQWTRNALGSAVTHLPLFDTVYHDHLRVVRVGAAFNFENDELPPAPFHVLGRQTFAAHVGLGRVPFTGALLNEHSLADNAAHSASYAVLLDYARRTVLLLEQEVVRAHVALGERLRDPALDVDEVDLAPLGPALAPLCLPGGTVQPLVVAAAFARPDTRSVVLLLQNWTAAGDAWVTGLPLNGGDQPYTLAFDTGPLEWETARVRARRVLADGRSFDLGALDAERPVVLSGVLEALTAEAIVLTPLADG